MMKKIALMLLSAAIAPLAAHATSFTITIDNPTIVLTPGNTVAVFGTIVNTSASTLFINDDSFTLGSSATFIDQFLNTPATLAPAGQTGSSSGDIELFDITLNATTRTAVPGSYSILGGLDGNGAAVLGTATFTVSSPAVAATPEPSSLAFFLTGMLSTLPVARRLRRRTA